MRKLVDYLSNNTSYDKCLSSSAVTARLRQPASQHEDVTTLSRTDDIAPTDVTLI